MNNSNLFFSRFGTAVVRDLTEEYRGALNYVITLATLQRDYPENESKIWSDKISLKEIKQAEKFLEALSDNKIQIVEQIGERVC